MNIPEFLQGFAKREPVPIKAGDLCRNKTTGVYSKCLNVHSGLYFGKTKTQMFEMGKIENFEKG